MASVIQRQPRPPVWRDVRILKWVVQFVMLGAVIAFFVGLYVVATGNIEEQGQTVGFAFLSRPIGITLSEGFATTPDSGAQALAVGMMNMLRLTVTGIFAATLLGTVLGVARLSSNWAVNKAATGYIEVVRNIPLLVQIVFWQVAVRLLGDATAEKSVSLPFVDEPVAFYSAKGFAVPWFSGTETRWQWVLFMTIGIVATVYVFRWRIKVQEAGKGEARVGLWSIGSLLAFGVIGWFAHPIVGFVGNILDVIASFFGSISSLFMSTIIAAIILFVAYRVVRARLDSLKTPSGYGKFSDDDWYRIIMASVIGLGGAFIVFRIPQLTQILTGQEELWGKQVGLQRIFAEGAERFEFGRSGAPFDFQLPQIAEGRFVNYDQDFGKVVSIGFAAMWFALVTYTASFIGEAVRAGVMAVPKGQTEAGLATGLKRSQLLRMIVLPQAFRIVLPPIGNQYLNLAKNTSLAIIVGYSDLVQAGQTIFNQTGQTLSIFLIWMAFYMSVSLVLSSIVNYFNNRLKLVER